MATVKMPQLGESVTEGTILKWLKQPGDPVKLDEPLLGARYRVPLVVQQAANLHGHVDVSAGEVTVRAAGLLWAELLELPLPIAEHVGLDAHHLCDLANLEEAAVRETGTLPGHAAPLPLFRPCAAATWRGASNRRVTSWSVSTLGSGFPRLSEITPANGFCVTYSSRFRNLKNDRRLESLRLTVVVTAACFWQCTMNLRAENLSTSVQA